VMCCRESWGPLRKCFEVREPARYHLAKTTANALGLSPQVAFRSMLWKQRVHCIHVTSQVLYLPFFVRSSCLK